MKLKYIIASIAAVLFVATGCQKEKDHMLSGIKLSSSIVVFTPEGGAKDITVSADEAWTIKDQQWIEGTDTTVAPAPKWLTVSKTSGAAGDTKITLSASATTAAHDIILKVECGKEVQNLNVIQQAGEVALSTCADVLKGTKGQNFRVQGVCTKITGTYYGNWYMNDGSTVEDLYIYGTVDEAGSYNWESFGIEVGDLVTVEGPLDIYNGTYELKNVSVISVIKSLLKILPEEGFSVEKSDTLVEIKAVRKGDDLKVVPLDDFIKIGEITVESDTTYIKLYISANDGAPRVGSVQVSSTLGNQTTTLTVPVSQMGNNVEIGSLVLDKPAYVIGQVTGICAKGFILSDETASVLHYNASYEGGFAIGDVVAIKCSKVTAYNKGFQLDKANCSEVTKISEGTYTYPEPFELTAAEIDKAVAVTDNCFAKYVSISGKLSISSGKYFNISVDGTTNQGSIYQIPTELKEQLVSGKSYRFLGYLSSISSGKYANILVTQADELQTFKKVTAVTSGKSYLFVFADSLALDNVPQSKTYGYPTASACKAVEGTIVGAFPNCEYTFTAVEGGFNMTDSYSRFVYLYKDGGKSFNVAEAIPETPANCGLWTVSFDGTGIATVKNSLDNSWIQYSTKYSSAGSYKTAQTDALMPVLYEKQ